MTGCLFELLVVLRDIFPREAGRASFVDHQFLVMSGSLREGCHVSPYLHLHDVSVI